MDFGTTVPMRGPLAEPASIGALARETEALGFGHISVTDHLIVPRQIASPYPYTDDGRFPGEAEGFALEQFSIVSYLAALTTTAKLITAITVVPHRGAILAAKTVSTIDYMSGGRMILGIGTGWMREEFDALNIPPFDDRGRVTDEYLRAYKELWTSDTPTFHGSHVEFADISFQPKPVQAGGPPIWVGGESGPALRRTVTLGDAWFPIMHNPRNPLNTLTRFRAGVKRMRCVAEEHNRDPASVGLALFAIKYSSRPTIDPDTGERDLLTGSNPEIVEDLQALAEIGVTEVVLNFHRSTMDKTLDGMRNFAEEIAPKL